MENYDRERKSRQPPCATYDLLLLGTLKDHTVLPPVFVLGLLLYFIFL